MISGVRITGMAVAAMVLTLAVVPLAAAGNDTSKAGYGGDSAIQVTLVESAAQASGAQAGSAGSLPMTGTDLGLLVAGGIVLLLVGVGMRRLGRQRQ